MAPAGTDDKGRHGIFLSIPTNAPDGQSDLLLDGVELRYATATHGSNTPPIVFHSLCAALPVPIVYPARRILAQTELCRANRLAVSISAHNAQHGVSTTYAVLGRQACSCPAAAGPPTQPGAAYSPEGARHVNPASEGRPPTLRPSANPSPPTCSHKAPANSSTHPALTAGQPPPTWTTSASA